MAKDKKGFILYADQISIFDALTDAEAGVLIKHIFKYVTDQNPIPNDNRIIEMAFIPIKQQLKRDLVKYEGTKDKKSESGVLGNLKRWNLDLYNQVIDGKLSINEAVVIATSRKTSQQVAKIAVKDNVNVKDNVKDNVSVNTQLNQWFKDLPNSMDLEDIARALKIDTELLKTSVEDFRKHSEINYPTYAKFVFHFKNWVAKNPPKRTKKTIELK